MLAAMDSATNFTTLETNITALCEDRNLNNCSGRQCSVACIDLVYKEGGALAALPWPLPDALSLLLPAMVVAIAVAVWHGLRHGERGLGSSSGGRVFFVDNCRFFLEALVISKHFISWFSTSKAGSYATYDCWYLTAILNWTESFHMPMFACCSGLLSKGYLTPARSKRTIMRVVVPWILLNTVVYPVFYYILLQPLNPSLPMGTRQHGWQKTDWLPNPFQWGGILWYLQAWLFWRITTGVFLCVMPPHTMLIFSYLISWMAGYWFDMNGDRPPLFLDTSLAWLPIYCTGYVTPLRWLGALDRNWVRACGLAFTVLSLSLHLGFAYLSDPVVGSLADREGVEMVDHDGAFDYGLYFLPWMTSSLHGLYFDQPHVVRIDNLYLYCLAWTQRAVMQFLVIWPTGVSLMVLVPHSEKFYTEWGSRTMYPYVGQLITKYFLMAGAIMLGIPQHCLSPAVSLVLCPLLAMGTNVFWASRLVHRFAKYVMEPTWIYRIMLDDAELMTLTAEMKDNARPPVAAAAPVPPTRKLLPQEGADQDGDSDDDDDDGDSSSDDQRQWLRRCWRS